MHMGPGSAVKQVAATIKELDVEASRREDDSPLAELLSHWTQFALKVRKFWDTKKAIDSGIRLYDWTPTQRAAAGYHGPWMFATLQGLSVVAVQSGAAHLLAFLGKTPPPTLAASLKPSFGSSLYFSMLTLLLAYISAWGSLTGDRSTPTTRRRTRDIYLYADAAYIFWPAVFLAVIEPVSQATSKAAIGPTWIGLLSCLAYVACFCWYMGVTGRKIPRRVFHENGYSDRVRRCWQERMPDDPPWGKLVLVYALVVLPIASLGLWIPRLFTHLVGGGLHRVQHMLVG